MHVKFFVVCYDNNSEISQNTRHLYNLFFENLLQHLIENALV